MHQVARHLILLLVLCVPATQAAETRAHGDASPPGPGAWSHGDPAQWDQWFRDLHLAPEQKQSLRAIAESYRPRLWELRQRGEAIRDQLMQTSPQDPGYAGTTLAASQAAGALASDAVTLLSQMRVEMDAVLTADQRKALSEQWSKRKQRWDRWQQTHGAGKAPAK
jgi:Spy/CpxP family protein refolding chaperone